ncbi:MAG: DNA polymerase III subunit gamma/tau [Xanthomonadaceae bacterium]|jgi:DNA polymerase-3 subunit gamma/tau|nr:DNA polymerase III subunit gamma/tau [Xanthomonadaceae bacterium]
MSYLVLARKWRPKRFSELVGQEHVVRALGNALESGRVHHAFLFTGTRGVGKTTIARIFAKSLNCERGTSAEPCGECAACLDIDAGRYIDLLEIDAASNTGVDDVREVIENAQYLPSRGSYKVYLIDEVHMLSKAAFNALLKTLEEPPEHVKFLLATTDPQKLPVTVLSRCLQFNLKRLDEGQISGQIDKILAAEQIEADSGAVRQIAKAADGSLRDALSLLDQTIAYAGGALREDVVRNMLGTVDRTQVSALLSALRDGDGARLMQVIAGLADFAPDWSNVLEALAEALHHVQVRQLVPNAEVDAESIDLNGFAGSLRPEVVQLWYQVAVNGRRDLDLAPSVRVGFEMVLLRMLAFRPQQAGSTVVRQAPMAMPGDSAGAASRAGSAVAVPRADAVPTPARPSSVTSNVVAEPPAQAATTVPPRPADISPPPPKGGLSAVGVANAGQWLDLIANCQLKGPARELAAHAAFVAYDNGRLRLSLAPGFEYLSSSERSIGDLAEALASGLGLRPNIVFEVGIAISETLNQRRDRERGSRQSAAEDAFLNDPEVQRLIERHGAKLVPDSIRPFDE